MNENIIERASLCCTHEYGVELVVSDVIMKSGQLIKDLLEVSCYGGNLHCLAAEDSVRDSTLEHCRSNIEANRLALAEGRQDKIKFDPAIDDAQLDLEMSIIEAMSPMTIQERYSVLAFRDALQDEADEDSCPPCRHCVMQDAEEEMAAKGYWRFTAVPIDTLGEEFRSAVDVLRASGVEPIVAGSPHYIAYEALDFRTKEQPIPTDFKKRDF